MQKRILITGSSRGIGQAIALELAAAGYDIVLHGRRASVALDKVETAVRDIQQQRSNAATVRQVVFDIADRAACAAAISNDIDTHGAYYGLVLNAGLSADTAFPAMTGEQWDSVLHTNLDGFYNVCQPAIMPMIKRRKPGRIVTLTSVSGLMGNRGQVNYSASKAGLIGASKALALEVAKRKITVNCVAPGLIDTDMADDVSPETLQGMLKGIPAQRMGDPAEVAGLVRYLCSDAAGYITRQVIAVNGGLF